MSTAAARTNGHARSARPRALPEPQSTGPQSLDAALLAFAEKAPKLSRNADGQVGGRVYRYVDLDALLDVVVSLLIDLELVWRAFLTADDQGRPALRYRMTHVPSGDADEDVVPLLGATDSQSLGSAVTYSRRYALLAYLNLAPGEDDDGLAASTGRAPVDKYAQGAAAHAAAAPQPTAAAPKASGRPASARQVAMIRKRAKVAELGADELANIVKVASGVEPGTWGEGEAERWLGRALDRLPARLVDAVLEGITGKAS